MKINKVTMTGADDTTNQKDLIEISKHFPFVEWGLLLSRNSVGKNRFPSVEWMDKLATMRHSEINLSGHLCGRYVNEVLMNSHRFAGEVGVMWSVFDRVQINTHGIPHQWEKAAIQGLHYHNKEVIFQYDGANKDIIDYALKFGLNCSTLFDMSHGAGVLAKEWSKPIEGIQCGYAGGLSPDNIKEQLKLIESKAGDYELWIDMETHVRSKDDQLFDLDKVVSVLESCVKSGLIITP